MYLKSEATLLPSGMWRHLYWYKWLNVSDELAACIIRQDHPPAKPHNGGRQKDPLKYQCTTTRLYSVTSQKAGNLKADMCMHTQSVYVMIFLASGFLI